MNVPDRRKYNYSWTSQKDLETNALTSVPKVGFCAAATLQHTVTTNSIIDRTTETEVSILFVFGSEIFNSCHFMRRTSERVVPNEKDNNWLISSGRSTLILMGTAAR